MKQPSRPVWVCSDCFIMLVNGEPNYTESDEYNDNLCSQLEGCEPTPGAIQEYHSCDVTRDEECYCEVQSFTWSSCEGCGSTFGGERHAVTLWF